MLSLFHSISPFPTIMTRGHNKKSLGRGTGSEERTPKKIVTSWLTLIASTFFGIALAFHFHYKVPSPTNHLGYNTETGLSDFSEHNAMNIISHLSDTIGYRKSPVAIVSSFLCWMF